MKISKLHYITNGQSQEEILNEIGAVLDAGCDWVQLRIKNPQLDFLTIAKEARKLCHHRATFIINDKVDIAFAVDSDGVHLGLEDMAIADARKILGEDKIIGGTANVLADCLEREQSGADYIGLGPYRMTQTKEKLSPVLGLAGYKKLLPKDNGEISIPVLAIGGITMEDINGLKKNTKIHGIAVSGLISKEQNKKELINQLKELLN